MRALKLFLTFSGLASFARGQSNCTDSFDVIYSAQFNPETDAAYPTNTSQVWTLCPNTEYKTGFETDGEIIGGMAPLSLRSNMTIKCGEDGKSSNNCSVTTGSYGFMSVGNLFGDDSFYIENAVLSGITFASSIRANSLVLADLGGSVAFVDCRFNGSKLSASVVLASYFRAAESSGRRTEVKLDGRESQRERAGKTIAHHMQEHRWKMAETRNLNLAHGSTGKMNRHLQFEEVLFSEMFVSPKLEFWNLNVTFDDCVFENNQIVEPSEPSLPAFMIDLFYSFEYVTFRNCMFRNNDLVGNPAAQAALTALVGGQVGGHIFFDTCCFIDNKVIGPGYAMAANEQNATLKIIHSNTYAPKNEGQQCAFSLYNVPTFTNQGIVYGEATCVDEGLVDVCMIGPTAGTITSAPASTETVAPGSVAPAGVSGTPITDGTAAPEIVTPGTAAPEVVTPGTAAPEITEAPDKDDNEVSAKRNTPPPTAFPTPTTLSASGTPLITSLLRVFVVLMIDVFVA